MHLFHSSFKQTQPRTGNSPRGVYKKSANYNYEDEWRSITWHDLQMFDSCWWSGFQACPNLFLLYMPTWTYIHQRQWTAEFGKMLTDPLKHTAAENRSTYRCTYVTRRLIDPNYLLVKRVVMQVPDIIRKSGGVFNFGGN